MKTIPTPNMKDFLYSEFMKPNKISFSKLSRDTNIPLSKLKYIIYGKGKMTRDISSRLGKYFGVNGDYFFDLQNSIDFRNAKRNPYIDKLKQ